MYYNLYLNKNVKNERKKNIILSINYVLQLNNV